MSLQIGQKAPEFSLYNTSREKVNLSDFEGKQNVVLLFFPQAFTGGCVNELCIVRDDMSKYNEINAKVISISVDSTATLAKFKEDQQYNFTMLSDFNKEVSPAYHAFYEFFTDMKMRGVSKRSAFVIDKKGVIQYVEVLENPAEVPNFQAIIETLKRLG